METGGLLDFCSETALIVFECRVPATRGGTISKQGRETLWGNLRQRYTY